MVDGRGQHRFCSESGLLVDGDTRLPTDVSEYCDKGVTALVGCSRLRCARCEAWVRGGAPGLGFKDDVPIDVAAIYAAEDWNDLPFVQRRTPALMADNRVRLYVCKCRCWEATRNDWIDNEHDSPNDPNLPWACAGHPLPQLPATLGELTVGDDGGWAQVVGTILGGVCPHALLPKDQDEGPGSWLAWLHVYLAGLPAAEQLASAIRDRIDDRDPLVVGRVLYFFSKFPRAPGIEDVIARAEAAVERVAVGYPIPEAKFCPTIWQVVISRLEQRSEPPDPLDARADDILRKVLVLPLSSLSHEEELGPTDRVEVKRQEIARTIEIELRRRAELGQKVDRGLYKIDVDGYARLIKHERVDVVAHTLERYSSAFDDADLRIWIADHIVDLDAAGKGRWRVYMNLLTDWHRKPELGHLIVIAGMRLIEGRVVGDGEFRDWMQWRGMNHGWMDDAWVLPLTDVLARQALRAD
jgi:hypothetical protein